MQPENNLDTQALEPTEEFAPLQAVEPVQPVESEQSVEPAQLEQSVEPMQSVEPTEMTVEEEQQDIVLGGGRKKNLGNIIVMAILAVLAVAGVAFGVVMMLNNSGAKNENVSKSFENPVIKNPDGNVEWSEYFESSVVYVDGEEKSVGFIVKNGEVRSCEIYGLVEVPSEDGKGKMVEGETTDCVVSGLAENIYKVVEFGSAETLEDFNIGFIMTDGSVYYVETAQAIKENDFEAKGPVKVGGYVVDAIKIDIEPTEENLENRVSSVFVLQDGSLVEFDSSMLK